MLTELAGRDDPDPTLVALTPIGLWAVREMLLEQGVPAPLVGELAAEDVEYVCVRLAGVRREVAEAELTAWVARAAPGPRRTSWHGCCGGRTSRRTGRWRSSRCGQRGAPRRGPPGRGTARAPLSPAARSVPADLAAAGAAAGGRAQRSTEIAPAGRRGERERCRDPPGTRIAATLPELCRARSGFQRHVSDDAQFCHDRDGCHASTGARPRRRPCASSWIRARCSGPLKLSA